MFERFTESARQVVVLAQEEARMLRHGYIGTEHFLLAFLRAEAGLPAAVTSALGIERDRVRFEVVEIVGFGTEPPGGQIPFTPRAKNVIELSLRESQRLGDDHVGTEHLVLGLVGEREGVAARVLLDLGVDLERVREAAVSSRGPGSPVAPAAPRPRPAVTPAVAPTPRVHWALARAQLAASRAGRDRVGVLRLLAAIALSLFRRVRDRD